MQHNAMTVVRKFKSSDALAASKLVNRLKKQAKKNSFDAIKAHVATNSVDFYRKLGFGVLRKVVFRNEGETYRVFLRL